MDFFMCATCRQYFGNIRSLVIDADRISDQLRSLREAKEGVGSPGFEPKVSARTDGNAAETRLVAIMDHEDRLKKRLERCRSAVDHAVEVLYGVDGSGGLYALTGWRADAIWAHYIGLEKWDDVAKSMGFSQKWVIVQVAAAFDLADSVGEFSCIIGRGMAE